MCMCMHTHTRVCNKAYFETIVLKIAYCHLAIQQRCFTHVIKYYFTISF